MAQSEGAVSYGRGCGGLECPVHLVGRGGPGEVRPHSACARATRPQPPQRASPTATMQSSARERERPPKCGVSGVTEDGGNGDGTLFYPGRPDIIGGRGRRAAGAAGLAAPRAGCPVAPSSRSVRGGRRRGSRRTRSRRPYMLDGTVPWLSSDLRVFQTGAAPPAACGPAGLSPPHALATKSANPFRPTVHDRHFVRRGASKRFLK
jgi:hypothetical protein